MSVLHLPCNRTKGSAMLVGPRKLVWWRPGGYLARAGIPESSYPYPKLQVPIPVLTCRRPPNVIQLLRPMVVCRSKKLPQSTQKLPQKRENSIAIQSSRVSIDNRNSIQKEVLLLYPRLSSSFETRASDAKERLHITMDACTSGVLS
jgi:hypothetical protein